MTAGRLEVMDADTLDQLPDMTVREFLSRCSLTPGPGRAVFVRAVGFRWWNRPTCLVPGAWNGPNIWLDAPQPRP